MKHDESYHSIQSVLSVLGEIHLLETYFNGFEKILSILLADKEVNDVLNPSKIFDLHSDAECVKSDIHNITKKLLIIAAELSSLEKNQLPVDDKSESIPPTNIKIVKKNIAKSPPINVWVDNVSKYFYDKYKNIDEDGEES